MVHAADLFRTYLAHHEPESEFIIVVIIIINVVMIVIVAIVVIVVMMLIMMFVIHVIIVIIIIMIVMIIIIVIVVQTPEEAHVCLGRDAYRWRSLHCKAPPCQCPALCIQSRH